MVHKLNHEHLQTNTSEMTFRSIHTTINEEFLNTLKPTGMPLHNLTLKLGAPIMLLRNLAPARLSNGTQLLLL